MSTGCRVDRTETIPLENLVAILERLVSNEYFVTALASDCAHERYNAKGIQAVEHEIDIRC